MGGTPCKNGCGCSRNHKPMRSEEQSEGVDPNPVHSCARALRLPVTPRIGHERYTREIRIMCGFHGPEISSKLQLLKESCSPDHAGLLRTVRSVLPGGVYLSTSATSFGRLLNCAVTHFYRTAPAKRGSSLMSDVPIQTPRTAQVSC